MALAGLLAAGYLVLCAVTDTDHILFGTRAGGIALGSMTKEEAVEALTEAADARCKAASLTVSLEGTEYKVDARDALVFDCEGTAEEAMRSVRCPFLQRGLSRIRTFAAGSDLEWFPRIDTDRLYEAVRASGILDADDTVQTSYRVENGQLIFEIGKAGKAADETGLLELIASALRTEDYETVIQSPVSAGTVEPVDLDQIYQNIHTVAENAALDPEHDYQILPSVTGVDFDKVYAQELLDTAEEGSTVAVDLIYAEPEITTQDLEEHLFDTRLSSFTTRVSSNENYITNVRLAAEKCDGTILLSGEEFSFNQTVGEQTAETGFKKASAIQGTKLIQAYGGGICQVSSALLWRRSTPAWRFRSAGIMSMSPVISTRGWMRRLPGTYRTLRLPMTTNTRSGWTSVMPIGI